MSPARSPSPPYDYTEGTSAVDIDEVARFSRRSRRDSQVGLSYTASSTTDLNNETAVFGGPGAGGVPTSVSRMSHREMSVDRAMQLRRMSSDMSHWRHTRRRSEDSGVARHGVDRRTSTDNLPSSSSVVLTSDDEEEADIGISGRSSRSRRRQEPESASSPDVSRSVFGNFVNIFGGWSNAPTSPELSGRRPSVSRRSTTSTTRHSRRSRRSEAGSDEEDEVERWGYLSDEEEDDSDADIVRRNKGDDSNSDFGSLPPSPRGFLPNILHDPIFGDTRIDFEEPEEPPKPSQTGFPSRQALFLADEDITIRFTGCEVLLWRQTLWRLGCIFSLGILGLLGHWFPRLWLRWVTVETPFKDMRHGYILAETPYRDISLFAMKFLDYPYPLSTVFPSAANSPPKPASISESSHSSTRENAQEEPLKELKIVDYRYVRYALNPRTGLFSMIRDWRNPSWTTAHSTRDGLTLAGRKQRTLLFDLNLIDIEGKSIVSLLVDEVIHPFYVFQIASIILWSLDDYYYYAFCIALISTFSIITTLIETKKTIQRMREMSRFSCPVNVLIDGTWNKEDSTSLVPGDVISLIDPPLSIIPADMFLLNGDAIVNESMLTGESVPVSKFPVKDADILKWQEGTDVNPDSAKSFLYAGTRVVRIRGALNPNGSIGPALAVITRTAFNTTKGTLIRSMLFPKPLGFAFYRDSMRFIAVLAGIACIGFLASAFQFVRLGIPWHTIMVRALDLITIVVPPALPATLSIGTSFAISRLRKSGIFCISPNRINVSGRINVCCFDKTGTLTEDGLDILGVRGFERNAHRFGELIEDIHDVPLNASGSKATFLHALATCHSLQVVDGEVVGDPLDVRMFNFTQWTLEEGLVAGTGVIKDKTSGSRSAALVQTVVRPPGGASFRLEDALRGNAKHAHFLELGVIRTFEFVSALRRMSVIVKRLKSTSMEVYVKGAPEVMGAICEKESFPDDYEDLLSYYTKRGYRVIAIAGKSIEGLSWLKAQRLKREQAESGLQFLGLVIFENKLKPGTAPVIHALRSAYMACRMITGDNPLTAVSVARECGMVNQAANVFCPAFVRGGPSVPASTLDWMSTDNPEWKLDPYSLKPLPQSHYVMESSGDFSAHDYTLVVTGDVFRWMINYAPLETLQRMFVKAQVFARMSPDEKNEVVERLQALGYTVLMCGDGANDCAALKAADVGLSLSEAEASVAAPFTSRTPDISCVLEVIKEGRAALVTSFSCFKYMALYSLIQFTTITLLYSFASSLGDFQFLYIDLFLIIPIAVTMGRSLPFPDIHPKRPTASLVSARVLTSIIGQIVITSAVQFWTFFWIRSQPWYTPPVTTKPGSDDDKLEITNYENSALFLVSCFQYVLVAAVFSIGPPYRKPMWTNGLFMLTIGVLSIFSVMLLLDPLRPMMVLLELMPLPLDARVILLIAVVINVFFSSLFENYGTAVVVRIIDILQLLRHSSWRSRDGKMYKAVDGGIN